MSFLKLSAAEKPKFRRRLLTWFHKHKRDLPWRRTRDPYRIWLSEIMLQQTRVAAVIPFYERFLESFPDVRALAQGRTDRVLTNWAGLGYYSRAKNLQRAAKEIVERHGGDFPREYEEALALPGIGHYTAAAVLSIAYDLPHAVLDGNVARVLARIGAVRGDLRVPGTWRKLEASAKDLLARNAAGNWNQAAMELGATVCTPKSPRCKECPVERWCQARKQSIEGELPSARKKRATIDITLAAAVLLDPHGRTLLVRQSNRDGTLFSHMWQFPAVETEEKDAVMALGARLREQFSATPKTTLTPLATARHTVTFRKVRLKPYLVHVARFPRITDGRIIAIAEIRRLPISSATRKIADIVIAHVAK